MSNNMLYSNANYVDNANYISNVFRNSNYTHVPNISTNKTVKCLSKTIIRYGSCALFEFYMTFFK